MSVIRVVWFVGSVLRQAIAKDFPTVPDGVVREIAPLAYPSLIKKPLRI